jgi:hypothetical protein
MAMLIAYATRSGTFTKSMVVPLGWATLHTLSDEAAVHAGVLHTLGVVSPGMGCAG